MTLQDYTDKLQELCHQGYAQKEIHLYATIDGVVFMNSLPEITGVAYTSNVEEDTVGINLGNYRGIDEAEARSWLR